MSYKNLINFQTIFNREDFNYISNIKKIEEVERIILFTISNPDEKELIYIKILKQFLENLESFYNSILAHNIPDIKKSNKIIFEELHKCINLFSESKFKRKSISRGYIKKFNKTFLFGLSKLLDGIKIVFDPDVISSTKIDRKQFVRFILNNSVGLGKKFIFNKAGKHSFTNKINILNMQELIVTARLLTRPSKNQIRTFNGWRDLGLNKSPIRILLEHKRVRKDNVFFLYRLNEHNEYGNQLRTPPNKITSFAA
jgi:hypothetical protein